MSYSKALSSNIFPFNLKTKLSSVIHRWHLGRSSVKPLAISILFQLTLLWLTTSKEPFSSKASLQSSRMQQLQLCRLSFTVGLSPYPPSLSPKSTDAECDIRENFDTNKYPNIFVTKKLHGRMSEYIHMKSLTKKIYTNEYPNIFV